RVLALLVESDLLAQLLRFAVDAHARETLLGDLLEELGVFALATAHERGQQHDPRALRQLGDRVDDLLAGLRADLAPALIAVRRPNARVEKAQVVVDLGHGADRRTGVTRRGFLIDRNRGR